MLEAPEALYLAKQINHTLRGKRIIRATTGYTPHKFTFYSGDTAGYEKRLLTKTICEANARGGMQVVSTTVPVGNRYKPCALILVIKV